MKRLLVACAFSLFAAPAFAQAPFPGAVQVGGGWVPCSHPVAVQAGLGCSGTPGTTPTSQFPWSGTDSPYGSGQDTGLRFELGKVYREPYGGLMRVVGTVTLTGGEMVFVGECLSGPQSSCPKERLMRFGLHEDRGAWHWEVKTEELPVYLP